MKDRGFNISDLCVKRLYFSFVVEVMFLGFLFFFELCLSLLQALSEFVDGILDLFFPLIHMLIDVLHLRVDAEHFLILLGSENDQ